MTRPDRHDYRPRGMFDDGICECGAVRDSRRHAPALPPPETQHLVRASDPDTSRRAAQSVRLRAGSQKTMLAVEYARDGGPLSDETAATRAGLVDRPRCCWWHRCSDLREDGIIERVGTERSRTTGEDVMTCQITELGRTLVWGVNRRG